MINEVIICSFQFFNEELVSDTMPSLVSVNEKLFICGVPFQFVGSAECLLFHLLIQDFE